MQRNKIYNFGSIGTAGNIILMEQAIKVNHQIFFLGVTIGVCIATPNYMLFNRRGLLYERRSSNWESLLTPRKYYVLASALDQFFDAVVIKSQHDHKIILLTLVIAV